MSDKGEGSSAALGKRKRRIDEHEHSEGSTLFVSNLPYAATSIDLQTLFSDIAPVRSAFVVTEQGTGTSKGVGYVSFAIKEDAKRALESIEKDGLDLLGRTLRVQLAEKKPTERKTDSTAEKPKKAAPQSRKPFPKPTKDPNAIRTAVISGLPKSVDQKTLWKKIRKCDGAESVELVGDGDGVAHATFKTPAAASHAVEKLHAHVFKGALLSVTLKKRLETLTKGVNTSTKGKDVASGLIGAGSETDKKKGNVSVPAPSRGSRLIVRNLPWDITETDLRALFLPYGPIHSVHIPTSTPASNHTPEGAVSSPTKQKVLARGFAFVWFFSKKDAEKAIGGVNGKAVRAGAIARPTMNRKERARMRRALRKAEGEKGDANNEGSDGEGSEVSGSDENDEEGEENEKGKGKKGKDSGERIVAVDWALSKEKWEKAREEAEVDVEASDEEEGSESGEDGSGSDIDQSISGDEDDDDNWVDENAGDSDVSSASDDGMDVDADPERDDDEPTKPTLPKPEAGTTLFVRNLPFEATEDELRTLFRTFGALRYARITIDLATGRSRGTGFVCFWNKDEAEKAVRQCEMVKREMSGEVPQKNPFTLPSLLTPDPSSVLAAPLVLHGRALDVTLAVTRDEAVKLKDDGERARERADKRNLWLLREGVIFPNSPAAANLPPAELEKRLASFSTRRALLKSNPLLYVSKTRLSVRQIPTFVSERCLKKLAGHAVKAFEEEVKRGKREAISEEERRRDVNEGEEAKGEEEKERGKGKKLPKTIVKQAKIVRTSDRVDALSGKNKSRGYGFVEMGTHTDALRVLRWLNNNPAVGALVEGWWKDELKEMIKNLSKPVEKGEHGGKNDKEEGADTDVGAKVKRAKAELEKMEGGGVKKSKGTLVVEFSIENSQVVKRRSAVQKERAEASKEPSSGPRKRFIDEMSTTPSKRLKTSHGGRAPSLASSKREKDLLESIDHSSNSKGKSGGKSKEGGSESKLGSIIGRKRKMRSAKAAKKGT